MSEQDTYAALADWFAHHPHQRPPASGATAPLRVFLAALEVQKHQGTLTPAQWAAIARWHLPLGRGQLLTVGDEWLLLRRISQVKALRASLGGMTRVQVHRLPPELRDWILDLRRRRQANPADLRVELVHRLDPHFPWRDPLWPAVGQGLKQLGCQLLGLTVGARPPSSPAPSRGR